MPMKTQPQRMKRGRQPKRKAPEYAEFDSSIGDADDGKWDMVKLTKFACKLCGQKFNHQPSLYRHQITAHGRQKKVLHGRSEAMP